MGDATKLPGQALVALGVAVLLAACSLVWVLTGLRVRDDASHTLSRSRSGVVVGRHLAADMSARVDRARTTIQQLQPALDDVNAKAQTVCLSDQQELAAVNDALHAGLAGDVAAYNRAVGARNALDAPHDTTVEASRSAIDALAAELAKL